MNISKGKTGCFILFIHNIAVKYISYFTFNVIKAITKVFSIFSKQQIGN